MNNTVTYKIQKILSRNDLGVTGSHQAGIYIPRSKEILDFFPKLEKSTKNPRIHLVFTDPNNVEYRFTFIYYNNRFFGGTRNTFRLTGMTEFFKKNGFKPGDILIFYKHEDGCYSINWDKFEFLDPQKSNIIKISNNWRIVKI